MGTPCRGAAITSNGQKVGRVPPPDPESWCGGGRVVKSPRWPQGREGKKQPEPEFVPPMSFIREREIQRRVRRHACRQGSKPQERSRGLAASEVERGGAGGDSAGLCGTLRDDGPRKSSGRCRPHGGNSLKTVHVPPPVPVPLFVDRASGFPCHWRAGRLRGTPSFPPRGRPHSP